jgi:hypothetical protein
MDAVATTFASATASPMLRSSLARVIRAHASEPRMALSRLPSRATSRHAATCASKASGDIAYAAPSPNGGGAGGTSASGSNISRAATTTAAGGARAVVVAVDATAVVALVHSIQKKFTGQLKGEAIKC